MTFTKEIVTNEFLKKFNNYGIKKDRLVFVPDSPPWNSVEPFDYSTRLFSS